MQLRSGDGSIRGRMLGGDVDANTGDGSIRLDGTLTGVRVHTGDGSVTIRADAGSSPAADWDIVTGDGSVTLEVPDGFGAELDAHTGDGRIHMQDVTLSNVTGDDREEQRARPARRRRPRRPRAHGRRLDHAQAIAEALSDQSEVRSPKSEIYLTIRPAVRKRR